MIDKCTRADYKPLLKDYLAGTESLSYGKYTPHLLTQSLGWHGRYLRTGNVRPKDEV